MREFAGVFSILNETCLSFSFQEKDDNERGGLFKTIQKCET